MEQAYSRLIRPEQEAASRLGEITVRTALGASRRRVVLQLFAEALVLSSAAATIGLATASFALNREQLPDDLIAELRLVEHVLSVAPEWRR